MIGAFVRDENAEFADPPAAFATARAMLAAAITQDPGTTQEPPRLRMYTGLVQRTAWYVVPLCGVVTPGGVMLLIFCEADPDISLRPPGNIRYVVVRASKPGCVFDTVGVFRGDNGTPREVLTSVLSVVPSDRASTHNTAANDGHD